MATVSALTYYPIKGCAGVTVDWAEVGPTGLRYDRSFAVVEPDDPVLSAVTQRTLARLAVIRAQVLHEGTKLGLSAPGAQDIVLDVISSGPTTPMSVHKWLGAGLDQGDDAAGWLSDVLDTPVRLMRVTEDHDRDGSGKTPGKTGFADSTALLITSLSSLDELNARLLEKGADPIPMNRFRPNIVVAGWRHPHTEDRVWRMSIGDVEIAYGKRDIRCVVTTIDQLAGERAGHEPLRTLADYRREPDGGVSFGMKAAVLWPGTLFVGDEVNVTEWL
jgi:uncharacterized protein YcbX